MRSFFILAGAFSFVLGTPIADEPSSAGNDVVDLISSPDQFEIAYNSDLEDENIGKQEDSAGDLTDIVSNVEPGASQTSNLELASSEGADESGFSSTTELFSNENTQPETFTADAGCSSNGAGGRTKGRQLQRAGECTATREEPAEIDQCPNMNQHMICCPPHAAMLIRRAPVRNLKGCRNSKFFQSEKMMYGIRFRASNVSKRKKKKPQQNLKMITFASIDLRTN